MNYDERFTQHESRLDQIEERLNTEKAERQALETLVVPPLKQVRQELELNIEYFTQRLESLRARAAGSGDAESAEDFDVIYQGLIQLLKWLNEADERHRWLTGIVTHILERESKTADLIGHVQRIASAR